MIRAAGILPFLTLALLMASISWGASCVSNGCHTAVVKFKFLHGPVSLEQMAGGGCVSCHVPAGKKCTASAKGVFAYAEEKDLLCTMCHEKSDSPDHVGRVKGCLKCHNPHGSDKDLRLLK